MNKKIKIILKTLLMGIIVSSFMMGNCAAANAQSVDWSVYYVSGGGAGETDVVSLPTFGGTYRAKCESLSGSCTYKTVTITAYSNSACTDEVKLTKTLKFSESGKYIDFELVSPLPTEKNIYFKVGLSHLNGTDATASGFIKIL